MATQNTKPQVTFVGDRLAEKNKDYKALLAASLAAFYEIAATLNEFTPLVKRLEKVLKLEGLVTDFSKEEEDDTAETDKTST